MARVKNGAVTKARHKKVLKQAKGYFGSKHRLYKSAKEQLMHSGQYAFRDRRGKKREFRKLWITRINAACRENGISYSRFIEGLNKAGVLVNRKMLSEVAINDPKAFTELVEVAKKGKEGKIKANEVKASSEVTIKSNNVKEEVKNTEKKSTAKKETTKKEAKKEEKVEKTEVKDYSKMTVAELKEIAKTKGIATTGLKKAEIIAALEK